MTQITLSPGQIQQLNRGPTLVECRDSGGKLVGYLHVAGRNDPVRVPDFTAEQLAEFEREPGGRSLAEILADLRTQNEVHRGLEARSGTPTCRIVDGIGQPRAVR
jgi:hypothetical protein